MALSFESRSVGDITVVRCKGRIIEGAESATLQQHLNEVMPRSPHILLHLAEVDFIDSSGLGLLVRLLTRARNARGNLKLCAVSPKLGDVLKATRLTTIFESHESEADGIAAFYARTKTAEASFLPADILCADDSPDVLAYVRELLRQAGYEVVSAVNLSDAITLLKATRPKMMVIGNALRIAANSQAPNIFNSFGTRLSLVELPPDFSTDDAGEAGRRLVEEVKTLMK